ncbi:MAG: hypothetical protein QOK39_242 [Acidimicrobiaceae bacterium]|jgi:hypothetical protein|nr:hypothetical protein [Acidimicrobiaceae bacterium]
MAINARNPDLQPDTSTGVNPLGQQTGRRASEPWAFEDPRRNRTAIPWTDRDTAWLIRQGTQTLTILRPPMGLGDAGATV